MVAVVWEIASALDQLRQPPQTATAVWVELPTSRLRGPEGRADNTWLRQCLRRLSKVYFEGHYKGDPWGASLVAEWQIIEGGALARLLVPPAGIVALRTPETFAKLDAEAVYRLPGYARRLYALLADKKRLSRSYWIFDLEELRALLGVEGSYHRFNSFRQRVLDPAVEAINEYGSLQVTMTPQRLGRSVRAVRFSWEWRDPHEATDALAENARAKAARGKTQTDASAPPLTRPASWQRIRKRFQAEHGEARWETWGSRLWLAEDQCDTETVTLAAPTRFMRDRIREYYGHWFDEAWSAEESGVTVRLIVRSMLDQRRIDEKAAHRSNKRAKAARP